MEKTVIPIKELAERWSCTKSYIYKLEGQGVLTRTKLSKACYPIGQVIKIELSEEAPTLIKVRELIRENEFLKKSVANLTKVVYGG